MVLTPGFGGADMPTQEIRAWVKALHRCVCLSHMCVCPQARMCVENKQPHTFQGIYCYLKCSAGRFCCLRKHEAVQTIASIIIYSVNIHECTLQVHLNTCKQAHCTVHAVISL